MAPRASVSGSANSISATPPQRPSPLRLSTEAFSPLETGAAGVPGRQEPRLSRSPGDVLASAVLHRLTQSCGVPIGQLKGVSTGIFDVCNETWWDILADCVLVVNLANQGCAKVQRQTDFPAITPSWCARWRR